MQSAAPLRSAAHSRTLSRPSPRRESPPPGPETASCDPRPPPFPVHPPRGRDARSSQARALFSTGAAPSWAASMISLAEQAGAASAPSLEEQVSHFFSPHGPLSASKNFEYRPQQQEMAVAVAKALERGDHLVVEAG